MIRHRALLLVWWASAAHILCTSAGQVSWASTAQPSAVSGAVSDAASGEPLRRVLVRLGDAGLETVTDEAGRFHLASVPPGRHTLYVSSIGYRLLKREVEVRSDAPLDLDIRLGQEAATIRETVSVTAPRFEEVEKSGISPRTLTATELENLAGVLMDDPLRSVQAMPGVATGDDFQSFYSIRGGDFRNNGIMVDGILTHQLVHTVAGTQEPTGSISILNGDMVESLALYPGGFSARYGDRTASYLDVITREGSRDGTHARIAVSGSNAAFIAEGPLGRARGGSWIVSARKSYLDYLIRRLGRESDVNLGFADVQAKLSYDLSPRHRVAATWTWGRASLDRNPANRGVTSLIEGAHNVGIGSAAWTFLPDGKTVWENRVYLIRESYRNTNRDDELLGRGRYTEAALRSDLSRQLGRGHRLEAGLLVRAIEDRVLDRRFNFTERRFFDYDSIEPRYRQTAGYVQDRWTLVPDRFSLLFGVRAERLGLTRQAGVDPRASFEWRVSPRDRVEGGWGVYSQFPEALALLGRNGNPGLRAEVSRQAIVAYERRIGAAARFRAELYDNREANLRREPNSLFRLVSGAVVFPDPAFRYDNALRGRTRGVELVLQRRSANRLSGWVSYAWSHSTRRDLVTGERYDGDFDQRHTVNVYASYRFSETWNWSTRMRYGSSFPYPAYLERGASGELLVGPERNRERLPDYSRIDARLTKAFFFDRKKLSLYVEVLNLLNHENVRFDTIGGVQSGSRRVNLSRDTLFPILPIGGFVLEF
jgi:outer membrane receptor for ferrienterochelin and colicin